MDRGVESGRFMGEAIALLHYLRVGGAELDDGTKRQARCGANAPEERTFAGRLGLGGGLYLRHMAFAHTAFDERRHACDGGAGILSLGADGQRIAIFEAEREERDGTSAIGLTAMCNKA